MSSFTELSLVAGRRVRLKKSFLPSESSTPREQFHVKEAPAPGISGIVVLEGLLCRVLITISTDENAILEEVVN